MNNSDKETPRTRRTQGQRFHAKSDYWSAGRSHFEVNCHRRTTRGFALGPRQHPRAIVESRAEELFQKVEHDRWALHLILYSSFLVGLIGGLVARALRLPSLVGYVVAGVLVGPNTVGPTVIQVHEVELLAEIGVALLLFSLGLEISLRDLQPVRKVALLGGPVQIVVTCGAAAFAASKVLGVPLNEATWLGAMISLSSTVWWSLRLCLPLESLRHWRAGS